METTAGVNAVSYFFKSFSNGDRDGILKSFHDDCQITAVRAGERKANDLYGTYKGKDELMDFLSNLANTFDTKEFIIDHLIGEGNVTFANGRFTHYVRATGKPFSSAWSLMCMVEDGKIKEYLFYEDSAALEAARVPMP